MHQERIKLACQRPADSKLPFEQVWTLSLLAETLAHQTGVQIGRSEVARWNRTDRRPFRWTFRGRWRTVPVALAA
jgi:transposase